MSKKIKDNINISLELLKNKEFDKAESLLLKNLEISNKNFETFFLLGTIYGIKKNFFKAKNYLKEALSIKPSHINSIVNLAIILKKMNRKNDSINYFNRAISLDKNNLESYCTLGQIYEEDKNFKKAETYYKRVLDIDSTNHIANHAYGKLLLKLNKHVSGLKMIEKVSGMVRFRKNVVEII